MDPAIIVAIIGVLGSATVAVLNHHLANRIKVQGKEIAWIKTLIRLVLSDSARANLSLVSRICGFDLAQEAFRAGDIGRFQPLHTI